MSTIPPPPPIGGSPDDDKVEPPAYTPPPPPPISEVPPTRSAPVSAVTPPPAPRKAPQQAAPNVSSGTPTKKKTNPVNVSLILGVLGFCGVTAIIGLIFGIIALNESKRNEGNGKVIAIIAIAINAFWLVLLVFGLIVGGGES